jgi:hyaluronoglucosaminidase
MFSDFDKLFDNHVFELVGKTENSLEVSINYDSNIITDGYTIDVRKNLLTINASSERGIIYAIDVVNSLPFIENNKVAMPIVLIEDEPSFKFRGIVEGYYGTPWTYEERIDMFKFMKNHRLNTYIYGPKTDIYHREKWCDDYPEDEINKLASLVKEANNAKVDFWYTISPGYHKEGIYAFDYNNEDDFNRLFKKIDQLVGIGILNFGLLLDDIDYKLSEENKLRFKRPGVAHAYICNRMYDYLKGIIPNVNFVMCPTEYHQIGDSQYRTDLRENLDNDIIVFFTGDNVCAEAITKSDMELTREAYDKQLFIWDNFPVSDFKYGVREYLGPIKNRTSSLPRYAEGYLINPSIHYYISKVGMATMADFAWNVPGYNEEISFEKALKEVSPEFYQHSKPFIKFNYPSVLSYGDIEKHKYWVENNDYTNIMHTYEELCKSAKQLLKLDLDIIDELRPWLDRALKEAEVAYKIIKKTITKEEILEFLQDIHFLGSEIIDNLIKNTGLLTDEEFITLITKRRGPEWYRIFEEKRWKK